MAQTDLEASKEQGFLIPRPRSRTPGDLTDTRKSTAGADETDGSRPETLSVSAAKPTGLQNAFRSLSSVEFLFWFAAATGNYLTVFLQKQGYKPNQVGLVYAVNSVVAILTTPFWGMAADRVRSIRKVFMLCLAIGAVLWAFIPASSRINAGPLVLMFIIIPLGQFFRNPAYSLLDAFVVQQADINRVAYGHVRLWGSISFAAVSILLSLFLPRIGVELSFYMYGFAFIPLLFVMGRMKGADAAAYSGKKSGRNMGFERLFRNYYFISYLLFAFFIYMPINTSNAFLPFLIDAVGSDTALFGFVSGYKALLEIPMLLLMRPLRRKFPLPAAIGGAAVLFGVEAFLYTRADSLSEIILIQTFNGLGGGLMIGAATNYVYSLAPEGLNSTAHTMHSSVSAVAAIIGSLVGGFLIMTRGIYTFYRVVCAMLIFALFYFYLSLAVGTKILKKPLPFMKAA